MGPLHGRQSFRNALLQRGSHSLTIPVRKSSTAWAPLLRRPQVLPGACSSIDFPWIITTLGIHLHCSVVLHGLQVGFFFPMDVRELHGTACLTMVFTTGCRGISATVSGAPPASLYALTLLTAGLFSLL